MNHEMEKTVSLTVEQQGKPFPDHVSQAFYNRGMVGWGKTHSANFAEACMLFTLPVYRHHKYR